MSSLQPYELFLIPIIVGLTAELIKFLNYCRKYGFDINYSIAYGHMPSAHTAYVTSLVTAVGIREGLGSGVFAIALIMAVIVIMDALRLRVYMGQHAQYINNVIQNLKLDESQFPRLKERVGHKPSEVIAGAVVGIALTFIFFFLIAQ